MCGIFGYIGTRNSLDVCLNGLKCLEYRGYDSAGIVGISKGTLKWSKETGKISALEKKVRQEDLSLDLALGHTRWATHGKPSNENAHPHFDETKKIALVHNGIIENYESLREQLKKEGKNFVSETDTEVIVQLIGSLYQGNLLEATQKALSLLKGSFAIALIHEHHPDQIIATARECPLCIGFDERKTEVLLSSDLNAFLPSTTHVFFLQQGEIAKIHRNSVEIFDEHLLKIHKKREKLESEFTTPSKEGFEHYMLKEIFEQDRVIQKILRSPHSFPPDEVLLKIENIWMIGCGTSAYAATIGSLFFEELAGIPALVDISSEARYRSLRFTPNTLIIAISQSGETADTITAIREAKSHGCIVVGICNVKNSILARESDYALFLNAGPEISVCSTKAFSAELAVLFLFVQHFASLHGKNQESLLNEFQKIPGQVQQLLQRSSSIRAIAKKYAQFEDFFFMGRRHMFPTCLEAALKLKEISYVNANGYPSGELKHGPIALLCPRFPVVAFCANRQTEEKIQSNLMEVKARGAPVLAIAPEDFTSISSIADDVIWVPPTLDPLAPFSSAIAGQLFAYYIAKERGCDIDQPRNLAKSVTVE